MAPGSRSQVLKAFATALTVSVTVASIAIRDPLSALGADPPRIAIDLALGTPRERLTRQTLEQVLSSYCYLELLADRELLGAERTDAVIHGKPWYTWIYGTVLSDEKRIAAVVDRHRLRVP